MKYVPRLMSGGAGGGGKEREKKRGKSVTRGVFYLLV